MISIETKQVVKTALGYIPPLNPKAEPQIDFELADELKQLGASTVPQCDRKSVASQIIDAYLWSRSQFPMCVQDASGDWILALQTLSVGVSLDSDEYISASTPHRPYIIFLSAAWPLRSRYRLASLLAHEMMHQALYLRERRETPTRANSLAYSPWKRNLRPGRLVWHAFWTFSVQFVGLAEATVGSNDILAADPGILSFLAEMQARIELCTHSLTEFDIVTAEETTRVGQALSIVRNMGKRLNTIKDYSSSQRSWTDIVNREVQSWEELLTPYP